MESTRNGRGPTLGKVTLRGGSGVPISRRLAAIVVVIIIGPHGVTFPIAGVGLRACLISRGQDCRRGPLASISSAGHPSI